MTSKIRGIRNNNPFNIKKSSHNWIGKIKGDDKVFETFDCMYHGIRAGMKLLINYVERGFDTPQKIIARFAPATENCVSRYVDFVCRDSSNKYFFAPDERIRSLSTLCILASRIATYECALSFPQQENYMLTPGALLTICYKYGLNKNCVLSDLNVLL